MADEKIIDLDKEIEDLSVISEIHEKVEYFRKKGKIIPDQILRDEAGQKILVPANGKRSRGQLKGVMVAYVADGDDVVRIGFSMCHPTDKWDHIKGIYNPGLGKYIANERGEKWVVKTDAVTNRDAQAALEMMGEGAPEPELLEMIKTAVVVPDSMHENLCTFVQRCKKYYKDKRFPVWVDKL